MKKFISLMLTAALVMTSGGNVVFAKEDVSKEPPASAAAVHPEQMQSGLEPLEADEEIDPEQIVTAIIELDDEPLIVKAEGMKNVDIYSAKNKASLLSKQKSVQNKISKKVLDGKDINVIRSYTVTTNGFAAKVPYGKIEEIRKIDGVSAAYVAPVFKVSPDMQSSLSVLGGMENTSGYNGEGTVIAIVDSGLETTHEAFRSSPSSPALTQDDITAVLQKNDLHAEESVNGLTAAQVYHNAKIPFAFDYADNDTNVTPGSAGDHGTHVAGIAAANAGVQSDVTGVASQAQILALKVFSSEATNGATWDDILAALDDAVCLGADVINMSLGSTAGFASIDADEGVSAVYQRVTDAGIMLAVAGGNEYSSAFGNKMGKGHALTQNPDYGTIASPSSYNASMAVASVDKADVIQSYYLTAGARKIAFNDTAEDTTVSGVDENSIKFRSLSGKQLDYAVIPGYGEAKDYNGIDVTGKIALVSRGSVDYETKKKAARNAGAAGIMVYNNEPGMLYMQLDSYDFPSAFISQADGQWLCDQAGNVKLNISNSQGSIDSPTSGQMSDFSSWGVTPELTLKPDITAPGGNIKSTITGNSYGTKSGTSMASPYVAGAMAVVKEYIEQKHASEVSSETSKADLVNSVLMSTADIVYEENGTPYSPRKQGAGSVNVDRAVRSSAYATVPGKKLPKIELGDDVQKTGVYTMSVDIHNYSDKAITYKVGGTVQTDGAEVTKQYKGKDVWQTTERPYKLEATVSGADVTVNAGQTVNVPVTVTLTAADKAYMDSRFENGIYVEGFITLTPEANDDVTLSVPYMGFYGDWTRASVIDRGYYWNDLNDEENWATQYTNTAGVSSLEGYVTNYLGDNPYHSNVKYLADRNAISPNNDDTMDALDILYTGLLRNVKQLKYTITGEDGTVYYEKAVDYEIKSVYSSSYYRIVPTGVEDYSKMDAWYGTDKNGKTLANGTKATVKIECELPYDKHAANNEALSWEFPITVDTEEPTAEDITVREENGAYYVSMKVRDNEYVSNVCFANAAGDTQLGSYPIAETEAGKTSEVEYNVTGYGEKLTLVINDYAGNRKEYKINVEGNTDDSEVIVPTKSIFKEDFEEDTFPANGWTVKLQSSTTWKQASEYGTKLALCDYANDDQNEWLISPEIDLASQETKASMIFDFWTNYYWSVQNHHHNLKVKASKDGGQTWTNIWQLWDVTKEFDAWTRTQAKVNIPEEFQNASNVKFALVYEGSDSTEVALDNVNIYVEDPQATHTVTATAGEGGTITPSGKVKISDGKSKEFKITPDEGNAVRDVKVDGESVGAVTSYKFENVTEDHTIEAEFATSGTAGTAEVIIDEDFDDLTSGGALPDGWTLKTTNSSYTWKIYKYYGKMGLYCSADTYDPDSGSGGWWSVNSASDNSVSLKNGDKQDERIILPAADLSGGKSELSYQFTGNTSLLKKGYMTCTVEVSNDGGTTWTELWNGKDAVDSMQTGVISSYVGTADITLEIPENLRNSSTQIAFRYQRPALSEDGGPVFIDNVKLTATKAAPEPAGRKTVLDEDFEGQKLPDGWTIKKTNSAYSWSVKKYFNNWLAYCDYDQYDPDDGGWGGWSLESADKRDISVKNGDKQDERLVTPALDLSGGNGELTYQFNAKKNLIKNGNMTVTVEASTDNGSTWTEIWNAKDSADDMKSGVISSYIDTADVTVKIPADVQSTSTLISFRYQSKAYNQNNGLICLDNIKVETDNGGSKPSPEPTAFTVTASAGQGGNISPSGAQTVNKGDDIEFTINASENYKIADVLVDGKSVGAVESYKFENVTENHTISASFGKTEVQLPDSIHEDFNASQMPEGWSVEGPSKTYNYETWKLGRYSALNNSNAAICSQNIMFKQEQNEKLIMPQIKMADSMKLTFDFGGSYDELVSGSVKLTVKATLNKGATWTEIWNAKEHIQAVDDDSDAPEDITGNGSVIIPAAYCSDNARFAFVFESNDRRNATVAVDNVVLEKSSAAPSDMYAVVIAETENGTVKADKTLASQGTQINLTVTPDEGYKLKEGSLRANGEEVKNNTFTMPAENVTVTAAFEKNGGDENEPGSYKDGVYRGSAIGFDGKVTVDVTVENGRISKIETVEQSETASYWEKALAMIEKLIGLGDDQSISNVDTVSGATVSSEAIQTAVLNALKNAKDTDSGIFASGSGTKQDPYIVRTVAQMTDLAESVNGGETYEGKYIALGNNISAAGITWTPIGTADHGKYNSFRGIFDGRGYTISDVTCGTASDPQSLEVMGIFGALGNDAIVKNLNVYIEKFYNSISTDGFDAAVGGIAGLVGRNAVIDHCTVNGGANALSSVESNVNSYSVGGIAGRMESGSMIADSWSDIGISDGSLEMDADMKHYVGGICGKQGNDSLIANCASFGLAAVSVGDGNIHVGGIVGETSGALYNCYSMSSTRGNNIVNSSTNPTTAVGMIAGNTTNEKALYNCYYYVNANQVIDFTDQASDEEEGKPERRKVVGYDSANKVDTDLSNVTGLSANKLASDDFADTMNDGRKKAFKSAADEYLGVSVSDLEDMLDNGYLSWSLVGDRVLIEGTQIKEQTVESVELLKQIKVPYGTKESDLDLPATVTAKFTDGGSGSFAVSWSCSSYDANKAGDYTFEGTLSMISGVNNPKDIKAYQVVTVEPSGTADEEYTLTVSGGKIVTDGTAGVSSGKYTAGTSITVKADDPASGKEFNGWTASGITLENASNTSVTFTMPANAVVLTANWKDKSNSGGSGGSGGGGGGSSSSSNITVTKPENGTITSSPSNPSEGSTVTVTVKPDNGYTTDKVTATDSKGNNIEVIKIADGKYAFIMPAGKVSVSASFKKNADDTENKMPFEDVKEGAYYYDPVIWAVDNDVTQGATATLFRPDSECTRAQVVTFLWRAAGSPVPEDKKLTFKDVDKNAYYYDAVRWATQNGITQGTSEDTFSPDATVTRAQFVTFMWRSEKTPDASSKNVFKDLNKDAYYYDAVLWAAQEGITSGTSADTFSPENSCTRGQVVTFLNRLFDKNDSQNK